MQLSKTPELLHVVRGTFRAKVLRLDISGPKEGIPHEITSRSIKNEHLVAVNKPSGLLVLP